VAPGSGPHLIFVPERPVSQDDFVAAVERVYAKHGRCLVAASEGITAPDGRTYAEHMAENLERDAHGNIQLSGSGALGDYLADLVTKGVKAPGGKKLRVRADTFGYLQRSFAGFVSDVDAREARIVGRVAVEYSADPANEQGSVVMLRTGDGDRYAVETQLEDLKNVARVTRHMPDEFLTDDHDVTDAWMTYVRPLAGEMPVVGTFDEAV
jgi:6-phosphofructokinase 1